MTRPYDLAEFFAVASSINSVYGHLSGHYPLRKMDKIANYGFISRKWEFHLSLGIVAFLTKQTLHLQLHFFFCFFLTTLPVCNSLLLEHNRKLTPAAHNNYPNLCSAQEANSVHISYVARKHLLLKELSTVII